MRWYVFHHWWESSTPPVIVVLPPSSNPPLCWTRAASILAPGADERDSVNDLRSRCLGKLLKTVSGLVSLDELVGHLSDLTQLLPEFIEATPNLFKFEMQRPGDPLQV
jgi:hypothetical protein